MNCQDHYVDEVGKLSADVVATSLHPKMLLLNHMGCDCCCAGLWLLLRNPSDDVVEQDAAAVGHLLLMVVLLMRVARYGPNILLLQLLSCRRRSPC